MKDRTYTPWLLAAMAIPLTEGAFSVSWVSAGVLAVLAWGLWRLPKGEPPEWLCIAQWAGICLFVGYFLTGTYGCWPGRGSEYAVPAVLLGLAVWAAIRGEEAAARAGAIFRYGIFAVLAGLLLSSVNRWESVRLIPRWRLDSAGLLCVLVLPCMGRPLTARTSTLLCSWLVLAAAVTTALGEHGGLYALSRSLSFLGAAERLESLTAVAMTLGYFSLLSFLLAKAAALWPGSPKTGVLLAAALGGLLYLVGVPPILTAIAGILLWIAVPTACVFSR